MMDPPKVLLERSFLHAVHDVSNINHDAAAIQYLDLVRQYEAQQILLVAVHTHLGELVGLDRTSSHPSTGCGWVCSTAALSSGHAWRTTRSSR